ncbi:hypothetical protein ACHAXR_011848 [Thalassiosira sp. AJA248-18]
MNNAPKESDEPAPKKCKVEERTCSTCKVSKKLDSFSKNQRSKGEQAKCKECITSMQHVKGSTAPAASKDSLQRGQTDESTIAKNNNDKNERAEGNQDEHLCAKCNITKKKENFEEKQRRMICKDCIAEALEGHKRRQEKERKKILDEYEEGETWLYNRKKETYNQYAKKLEAEGTTTIEKEMTTTSSNLVYVVTSINKCGDPFSPSLHGIFTTCKQAQKCVRNTFEKISDSYRNGNVILLEFSSRVMFEVLGGEADADEDYLDFNAIVITAARINDKVDKVLPFMNENLPIGKNRLPKAVEKIDANNLPLEKGTTVFAIFSHWPGNMGHTSEEVNLCGVYTDKNDVIKVGLELTSFGDDEEKGEQIKNAKDVANGILFHDEEELCWTVVLETVNLDVEADGHELDFRSVGSGAWMQPNIEIY